MLTPAGKVVLINAVLISLHQHIFSVYMIPRRVVSKIRSLVLKFFWGKSDGSRSVHWKNQDVVFRPRGAGGLGVRHVGSLDKVLLLKQCWRVYNNSSLLVARIWKAKYGFHA